MIILHRKRLAHAESVRSRRRLVGYTLIELLIVCAILGLSSVILIPNMVNRDSMNVQAAIRRLIGDLSFAQSDALAHQELRRVHFFDDGHGYCIMRISETQLGFPFDPDTADYINDPLVGGSYIVDFNRDDRFRGCTITDVNIDGGGNNLHYDEIGGTVASAGTPGTGGSLTIKSGNQSYVVTIAPFTGKLRVQ